MEWLGWCFVQCIMYFDYQYVVAMSEVIGRKSDGVARFYYLANQGTSTINL